MARVVVIGAGMGGMACAARLAALGHSVTIYEKARTWGGKLGTFRHDEFVFDTGPSLLTLPAVYRDLFLKTGRPLEDSVNLVDLDIAFRYQFPDGTVLKMPGVGVGAATSAIGDALGGKSAEQWKLFMQRASRMWAATRGPFLQSPLEGMRSLLALSWRIGDLRTIAPGKTLRTLAQHYFDDPRLVMLVDRYATYTGSDPRKAPAALATVPYIEQTFGTYHVAGGLRELGRAVYERCLALNVTINLGQGVHAIEASNAVTAVILDTGARIECDIVVSNSDAKNTLNSLLPDSTAQQKTKSARLALAKNVPSLSGFVELLALQGSSTDLAHHNVWFPSNYDAEFDAIFGAQPDPVLDPAIYVCAPKDAAMRPKDHESWFLLVNAPRHVPGLGVNWYDAELVVNYQRHLLDVLAKRGTDVRSRIQWSHTQTPADLEFATSSPGGSIYGSSSNGMRSAFLRPTNKTKIANLYQVGGSSHPGGGLPLVAMSADIVARMIGRA